MSITRTDPRTDRWPLRLWPGVLVVALQWLSMFGLPVVWPDTRPYGVIGGFLGGLAVFAWWAFFSRAPRVDRWGAAVLIVVALAAAPLVLHESIATGAMGMLFYILAIPPLSVAFVAWAAASRGLADGPRRATMVATVLLACGAWALVRTGGFTGAGDNDLAWRWSKTPEERLLARVDGGMTSLPPAPAAMATEPERMAPASDEPATLPSPAEAATTTAVAEAAAAEEATKGPAAAATADPGVTWPGFRGAGRDSVIRGVRIDTDWTTSPPVEVWRRPIGPGWSSFAVSGGLLYTQEQRGDDEVVACYNVMTGEPVWMHRDTTRFWESNGGAGPRGTPTLGNGRVYAFGATGILNALDAGSGAVLWSRNAASDTGVKIPGWGFSSSPLVVGKNVIVATSGALVAYDVVTGDQRWLDASRGGSYSSPHLLNIDGVTQVVLMGGSGAQSVAPADGALLWEHPWPGSPIVQPALVAGGDMLISTSDAMGGLGTRRIAAQHGPGGWSVEERWTSRGLKPYFNDFVVHEGHAFGFDGFILASIDLADGQRTWKGGRYGNGQLVLFPDQDVLLVLSEDGELALVSATPDKFTEIARVRAIEGKTWNHPVLVGDILLVRNGQEMAAFRLSLAGR